MPRPLLLIDVDGVLCPTFRHPLQLRQRLVELDTGDSIVVDFDIAARLGKIAPHFDFVWCTSWEEDANRYIGPLYSLPLLPTIRFECATGATWKLPTVDRYAAGRPLAWVDDELHQDAHEWAASRLTPTLLLDVVPSEGLTDPLVALLLDFAADIADERARFEFS